MSGLNISLGNFPDKSGTDGHRVEAYIVQLNQVHVFDGAIVTKIQPGRDFLSGRGLSSAS
jgi:hypothetical protein